MKQSRGIEPKGAEAAVRSKEPETAPRGPGSITKNAIRTKPPTDGATGSKGAARAPRNAIAKRAKIKEAGIESRVLGHVSGSVKRGQAKRDSN